MESKKFQYLNYELTTDPHFLDKQNAITPELHEIMERLYYNIMKKKKLEKTVEELQILIEKHPLTPQLKNYLYNAFIGMGMQEKADDITQWIRNEHPDYLFGKLALASEYFEKKEYEKIPEILGKKLELKSLYPDRDVFHLSEFAAFYQMVIGYYAAVGKTDLAESWLEALKKVAPDSPHIGFAEKVVMDALLKEGLLSITELTKKRYRKPKKAVSRPRQTKKPPKFKNQVIKTLYENDLHISADLIHEILSLPRNSLIADLELFG